MKKLPSPHSRQPSGSLRIFALLLGSFGANFTAQATTISVIDDFTNTNQSVRLTAVGRDQVSTSLDVVDLFTNGTRTLGIETTETPPSRSIQADVVADFGFFALDQGPGVSARTWLEYRAPAGMTFDLTMENAANCLALMVEFSQAPVKIEVTMESLGGFSETMSFEQESTFSQTKSEIFFDQFLNTDLTKVAALTIEFSDLENQGAPDVIISSVSLASQPTQVIPEPSSFLLLGCSFSVLLLRRARL